MVAEVRFKFSSSNVSQWLRTNVPNAYERATARGLNKGIGKVRTASIREIRQERNLLARDVRATMRVFRATRRRLSAKLSTQGFSIPLKRYKARVVGRRGRGNRATRNAPVQVEIRKGQKRIVRDAFIGRNGHVFARVGRERLPIRKLWGPSIPTAFVKRRVENAMRKVAERDVPGLVERELVRELRRAA